LRLGIASISGRPVAAQFWTVEGGTAFIHKLAHVEDARDHSPGSLLTAAMMERAIDVDRVSEVDFGTGDDPYKRDWMDSRRPRYRLDMHWTRDPRAWAEFVMASVRHLRRVPA
jgi:CelD/BcsL family acetyltransferase involved in cellulose biosynthesis